MNDGKPMHTLKEINRVKAVKIDRNLKFARLVEVLQEMIETEFTGHVKINFSQGGIGRIEKFEEILRGAVPGD